MLLGRQATNDKSQSLEGEGTTKESVGERGWRWEAGEGEGSRRM